MRGTAELRQSSFAIAIETLALNPGFLPVGASLSKLEGGALALKTWFFPFGASLSKLCGRNTRTENRVSSF